MNWDEMLRRMQEINLTINNGCDLQYLEENLTKDISINKYKEEILKI